MPTENNVAAQAGDEPIYCPFCGDAESQTVEHVEGTIVHPAYFVRCDNCGAVGPTSDRGDHRQLWNARVSPRATADVERDALALLREVVRLDGISLVATIDNCEVCTTGEFDRLTDDIRKYLTTTKPGA